MRTISIISIAYGSLGIIWGTVTRVLVQLQTSFMENFPFPEEVYSIMDIQKLMDALNGMWRLMYPFIFLIATIYIISGILQLAGRQQYLSLAFIAAILNIAWYLAYMVMLQTELLPLIHMDQFFSQKLFNMLFAAGMVVSAVFYCAYPVFLIIFLSQQKGKVKN
jgi:hypothetical protein